MFVSNRCYLFSKRIFSHMARFSGFLSHNEKNNGSAAQKKVPTKVFLAAIHTRYLVFGIQFINNILSLFVEIKFALGSSSY